MIVVLFGLYINSGGSHAGLFGRMNEIDDYSAINGLNYIENAYITTDGTIHTKTPGRYCSGFIPCSGGVEVKYVGETNHSRICGIAFYDAKKKFISGYANNGKKGTEIQVTSPAATYYCRISTDVATLAKSYVRIPNGNTSNILEEIVVPTICVPAESVAVVGREWNLYFQNIILGLTDSFYVATDVSDANALNVHHLENELRLTPTDASIGDHRIDIYLFSKVNSTLITSASFMLHVIPDIPPENKTVLFIGDSLTDWAYYPAEIIRMANGNISTIGTKNTTVTIGESTIATKSEGHSGWNTGSYMIANDRGNDNPFYNPNDGSFDFTFYMNTNDYQSVDLVSIFLGTNRDLKTDTMSPCDVTVDNLKKMIKSIHDYNKDIKIVINLLHMPATQDGTGMHNNLQNSSHMVYQTFALNRRLIDTFENNSEYPNVYISELIFNLDNEHDYPTIDVPVSARNPEIVSIQDNNVHPSIYGYLKFADTLYSRMQYIWQR